MSLDDVDNAYLRLLADLMDGEGLTLDQAVGRSLEAPETVCDGCGCALFLCELHQCQHCGLEGCWQCVHERQHRRSGGREESRLCAPCHRSIQVGIEEFRGAFM